MNISYNYVSEKELRETYRILEKEQLINILVDKFQKDNRREIIFDFLNWYEAKIGDTRCGSYVDEYLKENK